MPGGGVEGGGELPGDEAWVGGGGEVPGGEVRVGVRMRCLGVRCGCG